MTLTAYADANHAGCQDTQRSTSGSAQFLRDKLVTRYFLANIMADLNILVEQAPAVAPPTRTDEQILPLSKAFTTSSTIPAIYIQQFWDTMCFNSSTEFYSCQLDEQWFNLHKDILRDALNITPANNNNPFVAPPSSDTVIEYVNTLGYPSTLNNAKLLDLIDQDIQCFRYFGTFLTDKKNLAMAACGKKKTSHLLIPNVRFTKLIIHHLRTKHNIYPRTGLPLHYSHEESILNTLRFVRKDGREIFGMPIPDALLTDEIKGAPYYGDYQEHVAKYQQFLDEERGKAKKGGAIESSEATKVTKPKAAKTTKPACDKVPKPTATQPPIPKPAPTQPSKAVLDKKRIVVKETPDEPLPAKRSKGGLVTKKHKPKSPLKLVDEPSDEGVPVEEPAYNEEDANLERALELRRIKPLLEVQGKGKEKVVEEQAAHDLLTLQTPKKKSLAYQFIFQRRPPMPTKRRLRSILEIKKARPNPGITAESQLQTSYVVHAGPNLEHMALGTSDASTQQKPEQMDEEFTTIAYLNVQENLKLPTEDQFFMEKPHEEESGKTNAKTKVQSMVSVPIHQDTSLVPPMTTLVIDLTTITTDPILVSRIGELEQHMENLIQNNLALEERLDKHGTRLYNLENLNIPHKVSQAVDEIVTDVVDWAMQAPLRARFRDLPTVDMKEILQQQMFEDDSYKAHTINNDLYEALQKTPPGSPPSPPPPPPPPTGVSGTPGTSGASRFESTDFMAAQELSPTDSLMQDDSIPDKQVHLSDDEDSGNDHLPKADSRQDWWKPLPEKERPSTPKPAWTISSSNKSDVANNWPLHLEYLRYGSKGRNPALSISKMKATSYPDFGLELLKFYIDRHDSLSRRKDVRTHMRILSVVRIKTYSRYGYDYLSEIILRRSDFQEHTITEKDFKNLYPSDFEDLNLLLLHGHLDHLPGSDKRMLSTAIKLWTQNLVIRQRVEDFQLGIESYQTQLSLTKPGWDATGYEFKHDYTIIESFRAIIFPVNNNERKIIRFNKIYKFSNGTLTHILEALDYRVKEFKIKRLNPGMNTCFWTVKDMIRSNEFITAMKDD
ncbi:hypothetical protein Tco_0260609 [Tanacetum coccineum]